MIVADNGHHAGCTSSFPGMLARGRTFKAMELTFARRNAPWLTMVNIVMIAVGVIERSNAKVIALLSIVILLYVLARTALIKRVPINVHTDKVSYSLAPISVWLDHFSYYGMLAYVVLMTGHAELATSGLAKLVLFFLVAFLAFICVTPIWSYFIYRKRQRETALNR